MKRLILICLAAAIAQSAFAQLYKYVDKDGKTVYTDQPPPSADSKRINVPPTPSAPAAAAQKSALEKDKELEKARKEGREEAKKADETARRAEVNAERCANARSNYEVYQQGGRILKRNASGERAFLDDSELAAEKEKARVAMDDACKKG
jgi:hypothetical protein